jgi:hypothetical protein
MIGRVPALFSSLAFLAFTLPLCAVTDRPLQSIGGELQPSAATATTADVTFVAGGDNRPTGKGAPMPRVLRTIFDEIALLHPDLVLWSGDTVYGYCDTKSELAAEYDAFFAAAARGGVPLYNAPGNHEIHSGQTCPGPAEALCGTPCSEEMFKSRFGQLYGSFDYAGIHFISLDTDVPDHADEISGAQLDWLTQDLEKNKTARAIFIFCHTEFYSAPKIDPPAGSSHPAIYNRVALHELFRRYPVRAVFAGHEHLYWREPAEQHDGIEYFVAGGAGAPLYASPDRGGFSHYLLVRLSGAKVSYDLIEPGHLYVEPGVAKDGEARFWIVNSNDLAQPMPLRGIDIEVSARLGGCKDLEVTSETRSRDKVVPVPGVTIASCVAAPGGRLRLHIEGPPVGQGSFLVTVKRRAGK